jgi:uncharacterized membrane protein YesL
MAYPIRKLSFGEIFDQSFRLMRHQCVPLSLGFVALYLPMSMASLALASNAFGAISILLSCVFFALVPLLQLIVTIMVAEAYVSKPISYRNAMSRAKPIAVPYLGTTFLMSLGLLLGFLLLIVPGVYLFVAWALIGPICAFERLFGTAALRRSRDLTQGHYWRVFALFAIIVPPSWMASIVFEGLGVIVPIVAKTLSSTVTAFFSAYTTVLTVVLYIDLRCRREDFDLELLAREVAGSGQGPTRPSAGGSGAAAA